MNISYKNYPEIMKSKGLDGFKTDTDGITENQKSSSNYIVNAGESLWSIAEKYYGEGSRYKEIKKINGLDEDKIYPGQVLKI